MKKYAAVIFILSLVVAVSVSAQTSVSGSNARAPQSLWQKLMSIGKQITGSEQTAAVVTGVSDGEGSTSSDKGSGEGSSDSNSTGGASRSRTTSSPSSASPFSGTTVDVDIESEPAPLTGGCARTLTPLGLKYETIRCDGENWVAAGNLLNDSKNIGLGFTPQATNRLFAISNYVGATISSKNSEMGDGVFGMSAQGIGVRGSSHGYQAAGVYGLSEALHSGMGVYGSSNSQTWGRGVVGESARGTNGVGVEGIAGDSTGVAVLGHSAGGSTAFKVQTTGEAVGYGFYQGDSGSWGSQVKNYFEGKLQIGDVPTSQNYPNSQLRVFSLGNSSSNAITASSINGTGLEGVTRGIDSAGVRGTDATERGVGVEGIGRTGVHGISNGDSDGFGVVGQASGPNSVAILGRNTGPQADPSNIAIKADATRSTGYGFYQTGVDAKNHFDGDLQVGGTSISNGRTRLQVFGEDTTSGGFGGDAIYGRAGSGFLGVGVLGEVAPNQNFGVGVKGVSRGGFSTAVMADASNGFIGFSQDGENALNLFDGKLKVGASSDLSIPTGVKVKIEGGLQIVTASASSTVPIPTCQVSTRGTFWFTQGNSGVADSAQVCAKNSDGTFVWKNLF